MKEDQYLSIASETRGLYKEKGSRFISIAYPANSLVEAQHLLNNIKKEFHDARHHCYAYKLGITHPEFRYYDDGEPSGTAGRPILGQIESFSLTNILVVVVRYFGGVKLGTGGLMHAYQTAAREALQGASIVSRTLQVTIGIKFPYSIQKEVMKIIKDESLVIADQEFTTEGRFDLMVSKGREPAVRDRLSALPGVMLT